MNKQIILLLSFTIIYFGSSNAFAQNSSSSSSPAAQHDSSPTFGGLGQSRTKIPKFKKKTFVKKRKRAHQRVPLQAHKKGPSKSALL